MRAAANAAAAENALHLAQFAGLLDCTQRAGDGVEQEEQDEHAILVHVQLAVAGLVAIASNVMQPLQQGLQLVEILLARDVLFADFFAFFPAMRE